MWNRRDEDEEEQYHRPAGRSWSSRLAWLTLLGGAALVITRVSVATVVQVHGDGMAPTLLHGEQIVLLRDRWSLERGDIVVYDPSLAVSGETLESVAAEHDAPRSSTEDGDELPDMRRDPNADFRNTAVVDPEELEENWEKVQRRSEGIASRERMPLRVGRVLAVPGDLITVHVPDAPLGLAVNGDPLQAKPAEPIRISLRGEAVPPADPPPARMRGVAYELTGERRYPVLTPVVDGSTDWVGLGVPEPEGGPVELEAPAYLVVADNRDEGACCDSRALGWIPADAIHGKVLMRLPGDPSATPDLDPSTRGLLWEP